ncbi:glycoside hydrolase family 19 protein, partial [Methylobacterium indicum]|uniref:glycoside hydrolase family 19 protein n=1 Tax=Methylobacterium indicum TaxID=1775910 RepID=UPI000652EF93
KRMEPVREGFAETDAGARAAVAKLFKAGRISKNYALPNAAGASFYGRGDVQLTFERNYVAMGRILNLPLAANPDLVLDPAVSARVMWEGLLRGASNRGDFTGKALEDYISGTRCDYVGARRTVNGTDKAEVIAGYARAFESALIADGVPAMAPRPPIYPPAEPPAVAAA